MDIIEKLLELIAKWKIEDAADTINQAGFIAKIIIRIAELYLISPWFILGPLLGIAFILLIIIIIIAYKQSR